MPGSHATLGSIASSAPSSSAAVSACARTSDVDAIDGSVEDAAGAIAGESSLGLSGSSVTCGARRRVKDAAILGYAGAERFLISLTRLHVVITATHVPSRQRLTMWRRASGVSIWSVAGGPQRSGRYAEALPEAPAEVRKRVEADRIRHLGHAAGSGL